ncbi:hypothetical protein HAX54_025459, partial [Datura stramonium]|nr:hypothetical protein [Datura stramonium]
MHTSDTKVRIRLERVEDYYISFKENPFIHAEAQFDVESFKNACPDIYYQIGMCDLGLFTILVDPYLPELVWEYYASYRARQLLLNHKGCTEILPCPTSVWVCGKELVRLAKAIPSMIQLTIKKALQPAKDKLTSLCSIVEVLESKVVTLRKEVVALSAPPSTNYPTHCEPASMPA